jgi:hypothetical protein
MFESIDRRKFIRNTALSAAGTLVSGAISGRPRNAPDTLPMSNLAPKEYDIMAEVKNTGNLMHMCM